MNQTTTIKWPIYIWTMPLIGGFLTLLGLLLPAAYLDVMGEQMYLWTWGLGYLHSDTLDITVFELTTNNDMLFASISYSLPILVGGIGLFLIAGKKREKLGGNSLLLFTISILIIGSLIGWMYYMEIEMSKGVTPRFWGLMHVGFGVIGPLSGAIISLVGGVCSKYANSHYTRDDLSSAISETDRTFHQRKYRCMNCSSKTSKLAFQPEECLKCGSSVFQVL